MQPLMEQEGKSEGAEKEEEGHFRSQVQAKSPKPVQFMLVTCDTLLDRCFANRNEIGCD